MTDEPEEGAAVPLIIALFAVALAFVTVVAAATSLHLDRLRLLTVADAAALAGAESFRVSDVRVTGDRVEPTLAADAVRAAVDASVREADRTDLDELAVQEAGTRDGRSATVVLSARSHPPLVSALLPDGVVVSVTSTAAARFR